MHLYLNKLKHHKTILNYINGKLTNYSVIKRQIVY